MSAMMGTITEVMTEMRWAPPKITKAVRTARMIPTEIAAMGAVVPSGAGM